MNVIKLSDGIIAIGGLETDASLFSMKIANYLAKTENVLFIPYLAYFEKVKSEIRRMDGFLEKNLEIEDGLKHFNVEVFLYFIRRTKEKSLNTIVIDDIESFVGNEYNFETIFEDRNDSVLDSFVFLFINYGVRILFNTSINKGAGYPSTLPAFCWNRTMIKKCNQIYAINRPQHFGITEDVEGKSTENDIEIYSLKNEECLDEKIVLDNSLHKIY